MTKKHFQALAELIKGLPEKQIDKKTIAEELKRFCYGQNPRFDGERFLNACGIKEA